ncbi:MAG: hypothetical protein EA442_04155 [Candidatus Nitrosopelagicus sp.]|nr:MAG: hypothetical protein EA442_04155 [Candidatus Nitrosopelagicus sp.]
MKSYSNHLASRLEYGETVDLSRKPILRSSGIFPVIKNKNFSSRILFMGYWLLKRNIPEVGIIITLRANNGNILLRKIKTITSTQAFSVELNSLLSEIHLISDDFLGSLEIEFNTTRDMVFPYPALVLQFFGEDFSSCVHTIERIYNDFEDMVENEQSKVPETGFDIHSTDDLTSFAAFVNGPLKNHDGIIDYIVTNSKSEKLRGTFHLGPINPYESKLIKLGEYIPELKNFLENNSGSISLNHNFEGFYPRLLVGNMQHSFPSVSFTHSYYDCTSCNSESDFWSRTNENFYDSSVYVPLFLSNDFFTELIIYPNFSPSDFYLDIVLYDAAGKELHKLKDFILIKNKDSKLLKINFNKIINELNFDKNTISSANIITKFVGSKIPSRIKFGLNVGIKNSKSKLPCNICFNTKVGNPNIDSKPGSFHWSPIFVQNSLIALSNSSPKKNYSKDANIELTFFRKEDSKTLSRNLVLTPFSEFRLKLDDELKNFLKEEGWVTIKSDNPYIQGYYFIFYPSGSVAGDHFF